MDLAAVFGFIGTILSTVAFLPQVIRAWKTKETKDLSMSSFLLIGTGSIFWFLYGVLINELPIIIANGIIVFSAFSIVYLKHKHG
jgi:MtN3 and saliva related transmembrane protein